MRWPLVLFAFLLLESGSPVSESHVQFFSALNNLLSRACRHWMGYLAYELAVVHQQDFQILKIRDQEPLHAARKKEAGLSVRAIADFGHPDSSTELASYPVIDTSWFSPAWLQLKLDVLP